MTGPEHYLEAERLLAAARGAADAGQYVDHTVYAAEAQAHATLAVAAVTWDAACLARTRGGDLTPDLAAAATEWDRVT